MVRVLAGWQRVACLGFGFVLVGCAEDNEKGVRDATPTTTLPAQVASPLTQDEFGRRMMRNGIAAMPKDYPGARPGR